MGKDALRNSPTPRSSSRGKRCPRRSGSKLRYSRIISSSPGRRPPASRKPVLPKIAGYNIYRSEGEGPPARLNKGPLTALEFRDGDFSFGRAYLYFVRSAAAEAPVAVESVDSEPVKVEPVDAFPPAAPRGLTSISGAGFIALSWEPAGEPDLAGYRVWRRAAGETAFVLTPGAVTRRELLLRYGN